jgi:hypothetical protein
VEQQKLEVETACRMPELESQEAISRIARSAITNPDKSAGTDREAGEDSDAAQEAIGTAAHSKLHESTADCERTWRNQQFFTFDFNAL